MKIAILTIQGNNNGNRLQNYALQIALERLGHSVVSLQRDSGLKAFVKRSPRISKLACLLIANKHARRVAFRRFDGNFIAFSPKVVSPERVSRNLADAYDCFLIGSDQVWNPDFHFNSELEYLPMVPPGKKLSYAASFGVSMIAENRGRIAELLNGIGSISVRENAGAEIIRDLTGREAPVVLDPTLLLSPDDWKCVSKKPGRVDCDRPFVFKYVLGDDANERRIERMAQLRGLQIVDAMDSLLAIGPSEFVWLIAHSELVCTDSFHASVFALLHHKSLAIFERESDEADMSSRFDTLCEEFELIGHRSSEDCFDDEAIFGTDWEVFEARLNHLRDDSMRWLKTAIGNVALD